jgi:hypothetical protein
MNARRLAIYRLFMSWVSSVALLSGMTRPLPVLASHTTNPVSVTIAGSLQSALGCAGDWDPSCATTHLCISDGVWQGTWMFPVAGNTKRAQR